MALTLTHIGADRTASGEQQQQQYCIWFGYIFCIRLAGWLSHILPIPLLCPPTHNHVPFPSFPTNPPLLQQIIASSRLLSFFFLLIAVSTLFSSFCFVRNPHLLRSLPTSVLDFHFNSQVSLSDSESRETLSLVVVVAHVWCASVRGRECCYFWDFARWFWLN